MSESRLVSVLFTDIVGSSDIAARLGSSRWSELLGRHHEAVRRELERHRGTELDNAGDGFLAGFDGPGPAVRCARDIIAAVQALGIDLRAGVHIGECEFAGGKPVGLPVHIGSRVAAAARPNHVVVSSTVRELLAGSDLDFVDEGVQVLKGIPGEWRLFSLAPTATPHERAHIQLCGRFLVRLGHRRVDDELPGRQGKALFAYLVVHRHREVDRGELVDALWSAELPAGVESSLNALISKVRRALAPKRLEGRHTLRIDLGDDAWVDLESAAEALHRAESAIGRGQWKDAWSAARVTLHIGQRSFLPGEEGAWVDEVRRDLEAKYVRSLEITAEASLQLGGSELDTAERSARTLIRRAPFTESGYRFLMHVLDRRGNTAEALNVYENLRSRLREELGAAPGRLTQDLHRQLLG